MRRKRQPTLLDVLVSRVGYRKAMMLAQLPLLYATAKAVEGVEGFEAFAQSDFMSYRTAYRRLSEWRAAMPDVDLDEFVTTILATSESKSVDVASVFATPVAV